MVGNMLFNFFCNKSNSYYNYLHTIYTIYYSDSLEDKLMCVQLRDKYS